MNCSVCHHPNRKGIDEQLIAGAALREIAAAHGLSKSAIDRHKAHVSKNLAGAAAAGEETRAEELMSRITSLRAETVAILEAAKAANDANLALRALSRLESQIELLAKVQQVIATAPRVEIALSQEWTGLREVVIGALRAYPDASRAVVGALEHVGR